MLKPVKVMDMAVLAALLFVLNVRDRTPLVMVGAENVADAAVAAGLLNVGDPDNVTTSLPLAGMTETGVMVMVIVTAAAPARTSGSENDGPVRPPFTISGNDPKTERLRMRLEPSSTAALMEVDAA